MQANTMATQKDVERNLQSWHSHSEMDGLAETSPDGHPICVKRSDYHMLVIICSPGLVQDAREVTTYYDPIRSEAEVQGHGVTVA